MAVSKKLEPIKMENGSYQVKWDVSGGVVPKELSGTYTSAGECIKAIKTFQAKVREKVSK